MIEMFLTIAKILGTIIAAALFLGSLTGVFLLVFYFVLTLIFDIKEILHDLRMKRLKRKFDIIAMKARIEDEQTN